MGNDDSLRDKLRGGFNTLGKTALLLGIGGAAAFKTLKDTIVGDPPSTLRKTLVYGSAALALGYTACEDELTTAGEHTYEYLEGQQAERIDDLEATLRRRQRKLDNAASLNDDLRERIDSVTATCQERLDSLRHAYHESQAAKQAVSKRIGHLTDKIDSLKATYKERLDEVNTGLNASENDVDTLVIERNTYQHVEPRGRDEDEPVIGPGDTALNPDEQRRSETCWHPVQPGQTPSDLTRQYDDVTVHLKDLDDAKYRSEKRLPVGLPVQLDAEECPANTAPRPDYTMIRRNASLLDDLQDVSNDEVSLLRFNERHGNDLTGTDPGQRVAVYTP